MRYGMDKDIADELLPTEGEGRDEMERLYTWREKDALKQDEWETKIGVRQVKGHWHRWAGAQELKKVCESYQTKKDPQTILEAIYLCAFYSLPIPRWCQTAYKEAYRKVRECKAKSWDDVFGRPHHKGTHLGTQRQWHEKGHLVYRRIQQIKKNDPSTPIDGSLFESVGKELGIGGKTLTEGYYYKWKNYWDSLKDDWEKENMV